MAVLTMVLQGMVEETLDENDNMIYLNGTINEYLIFIAFFMIISAAIV